MDLFWLIAAIAVISMVVKFFRKTGPSKTKRSGFYLNEVEAMKDGKLHQMGDDDGGPGFYM